VANMGKPRDMAQRKTLARVDDVDRRHRVATARDLIYEKNYAVDSTAVKRLLEKDSLVPTAVCNCSMSPVVVSADDFRMHFRTNWGFPVFACSV
jgi:hypothetical protein